MKRSIVLLALALFAASPLHSESVATWTFADLSTTVNVLTFRFPTDSKEVKALDAISSALNSIQTGYVAKYQDQADTKARISANLSPEYVSSMADDLNMLKNLPAGVPDRLQILQEVRDDLIAKATSVSAASGAGLVADTFPSIIKLLLAVTMPTGSQINASEVSIRANPHHFGTKSPPAYILCNGTAQQSGRLPPGRFEIWVEARGQILKVQDVDLGLNGTAVQTITFSL